MLAIIQQHVLNQTSFRNFATGMRPQVWECDCARRERDGARCPVQYQQVGIYSHDARGDQGDRKNAKRNQGMVRYLPATPALGMLRKEASLGYNSKFQARLGYRARPCLTKQMNNQTKQKQQEREGERGRWRDGERDTKRKHQVRGILPKPTHRILTTEARMNDQTSLGDGGGQGTCSDVRSRAFGKLT
jgi:hypothetical protein